MLRDRSRRHTLCFTHWLQGSYPLTSHLRCMAFIKDWRWWIKYLRSWTQSYLYILSGKAWRQRYMALLVCWHYVPVRRLCQKYWDCGTSCLLMEYIWTFFASWHNLLSCERKSWEVPGRHLLWLARKIYIMLTQIQSHKDIEIFPSTTSRNDQGSYVDIDQENTGRCICRDCKPRKVMVGYAWLNSWAL